LSLSYKLGEEKMKLNTSVLKLSAFTLLLLAVSAILLTGCAPRIVIDPMDMVVRVPSSPTTTSIAVPSGTADAHFIQPNDYFYMEEPWGDRDWVYVKLGKLVTAPTPETKNQAEFMNTASGKKEWAKWWAVTRIATPADLVLGKEVIMIDMMGDSDVYVKPTSTQEARNTSWFIARITDTSELFKGYVMVSGGYKIDKNSLRVIVK